MRLFLAIEIPPEVQKKFEEAIAPLKHDHGDFRWVPTVNYHITMQFFGDVPKPDVLAEKIENALFHEKQFEMNTLTGGVFIEDRLTMYIDFYRSKDAEQVLQLIDDGIGYERPYKFIPHLTVAKTAVRSKQQYYHIKKKFERLEPEITFKVEKITLFESILSSKTPQYRPYKEFVLKKEEEL